MFLMQVFAQSAGTEDSKTVQKADFEKLRNKMLKIFEKTEPGLKMESGELILFLRDDRKKVFFDDDTEKYFNVNLTEALGEKMIAELVANLDSLKQIHLINVKGGRTLVVFGDGEKGIVHDWFDWKELSSQSKKEATGFGFVDNRVKSNTYLSDVKEISPENLEVKYYPEADVSLEINGHNLKLIEQKDGKFYEFNFDFSEVSKIDGSKIDLRLGEYMSEELDGQKYEVLGISVVNKMDNTKTSYVIDLETKEIYQM
jgi:hypothetical protein